MTTTPLRERIRRALERGPLYDGAIPLIVDASPSVVTRALRAMQASGEVTFDGLSWRLA